MEIKSFGEEKKEKEKQAKQEQRHERCLDSTCMSGLKRGEKPLIKRER